LAQAEVQGAVQPIGLLNPLSSELNVLRPSMLPGGLQAIAHNRNRQRPDGMYFEFGKVYGQSPETQSIVEEPMLALWAAGKRMPETWMQASAPINPFVLKGLAERLFKRLNVSFETRTHSDATWQGEVLEYTSSGMLLARMGWVGQAARKAYGVKEAVAYAEVHWPALVKSAGSMPRFTELPKFPEVRRDLALVVDHKVTYKALADLARKTEKRWLKNIHLFDVYQGDKLPEGKKSYAIGFTLYNSEATLTDQEIEQVMTKLLNAFRKEEGAELRG
jgi:phenylalanyl-tRNA synthetase beta chain